MVDATSMDEYRRARREGKELVEGATLKHGGGSGTLPPMEGRVTRLEVQVEHLDRTLGSIDAKLDKVNDRLNQLPTRADLRSWQWQWIATGVGIIALTVGGITGGLALIANAAH